MAPTAADSYSHLARRLLGVAVAVLALWAHLPAGAQESGSRPAAEEPAAPEGPVFPKPTIDDPELSKSYAEGITALEERQFDDAKKTFSSLRRSLSGEAKEAAERCYEESKLGLEIEDISSKVGKRQFRKAIRDCEKALDKFEGLALIVEVEALLEECEKALYTVIADFEESDGGAEDETKAEEEEEDDEGQGGRNRNRGGQTGFGQNTSFEKRDPAEPKSKRAALVSNVREGKRALLWRTGRDLSTINFDNLEVRIEDYRYLNISIRVEDPKQAPALRLFFDAEEGPLNAGGGNGGGRGGRRGGAAARVTQRMGFVATAQPKATWQDLRIDLKKFKAQANAQWGDVRAFRLLHMPGADGRVYVDNIRLERE